MTQITKELNRKIEVLDHVFESIRTLIDFCNDSNECVCRGGLNVRSIARSLEHLESALTPYYIDTCDEHVLSLTV